MSTGRSSGPLQLDVTAQTVAQQAGRPRRVGARGRHEGPEVQSGPSPSVCSAYAIADRRTQRRGRGRCRVRGRTPRVHRRLEISPRTRDSHTAHRRHLCLEHDQDRNDSSTARPDFYASTWLATASSTPQSALAPAAPRATSAPDVRVWVNKSSRVYRCPGARYYGNTKAGAFMAQREAQSRGHRPAGGRACS